MSQQLENAKMSLETGESEGLLEVREGQRTRGTALRAIAVVAIALGLCAVASFLFTPKSFTKIGHGIVGLEEADAEEDVDAGRDESCRGLPFVRLESLVSSNLGGKGPDHGEEEGMIFKASHHHSKMDVEDLEIHVHSLESFDESDDDEGTKYDQNYKPAFEHGEFVNGIHGRFAVISVKPGESVKVRVHAHDAAAGEDIPVPHGAISFFDLDAGVDAKDRLQKVDPESKMFDCADESNVIDWEETKKTYCCLAHEVGCSDDGIAHPQTKPKLNSIEHVEVCDYDAYLLTNETEIKTERTDEKGEKCATFTATQEGNGDDNPSDPLDLTTLQKNRAVTVLFKNKKEFNFEVGASEGSTGRVFSFVLRPSLQCAQTKLADGRHVAAKGQEAPVHPVRSGSCRTTPVVLALMGIAAYFL